MTSASSEPFEPPLGDALTHADTANALLTHIGFLSPGSVVAVQGPWGRGKTDVLARVYNAMKKRSNELNGPEPLWLNPWQYGTPDLISPLVVQILERLQPEERNRSEVLRRSAKTLLRAGNAMIFKALSVVAPLGSILEAGAGPIDSFIEEMFDKPDGHQVEDHDPVAAMSQRFREMVDEYLGHYSGSNALLLICIDDLDRCLPDHQIAMLEAIYFLTGARAKAFFLVALDPTLVQQAAITHYKTVGFDSNQYLDKLFDLRVTLRTLNRSDVDQLIHLQLSRPVEEKPLAEVLENGLGVNADVIREAFRSTFWLQEMTNPRLIARVFERLHLLARAGIVPPNFRSDSKVVEATVAWCAIAERWPSIRSILQIMRPDNWGDYLETFRIYYSSRDDDSSKERIRNFRNVIVRLPAIESTPDIGLFLEYACNSAPSSELGALFAEADKALLKAGL